MASQRSTPQSVITTHAVLTGLTPLIPVPFIDDVIYSYVMRSLVRRIAASHKHELTEHDVRVLASQPGGCGLGCVATLLIYPFKKVLRKILYFLEWKRATDVISRTYCEGYLLDEAVKEGWLESHNASRVREAINAVLVRTNTSPIKGAVYGVVKQSKGAMKGLTGTLQGFLSRSKRDTNETEVAKAVTEVENEATLENIIEQLQRAIGTLPVEFLQNLKHELGLELAHKNDSL
jgi:hypothetical protein